jgi:hypothetical protein
MARPRIVIVGGAFAGCHAARTLSRLSRGRADTWTLARVLSSWRCSAEARPAHPARPSLYASRRPRRAILLGGLRAVTARSAGGKSADQTFMALVGRPWMDETRGAAR